MDISNFQLDSVIGHWTENPCVGGSIPSLAINRIKNLRPSHRWPFSFTYTFTYTFTTTMAGIEIVHDFSSEDAGFRATVSIPSGPNLILSFAKIS